jgi:hypothetical protein
LLELSNHFWVDTTDFGGTISKLAIIKTLITQNIYTMNLKLKVINLLIITIILAACSVPKEVMTRIESKHKEMIDLPIDYCISRPTPDFEKWDSDYNLYNKFLTSEIMKTQLGMSFTNDGVQTWTCFPSAKTHTQLDTTTIIKDSKQIIGDWRIICNRKISFTDSAVYATKKIFRNEEVVYNEKEADVFLVISDSKLKMYGTESGENKFKHGGSKNYSIINGRHLMTYGVSKASGAISQIGIDKNGHLIMNYYWVQERKIMNQYITYQSIVTQTIFERQ